MEIKLGELRTAAVITLLEEHHKDMLKHSPSESVHALDISGLEQPDVTFWSMWHGEDLTGIGALKQLDSNQGEIKSMRTASKHLRKGVAAKMLNHIIEHAKQLGLTEVSLETGTAKAFAPAQRLYESFGFKQCEPFGDYKEDSYSMFMTKEIL